MVISLKKTFDSFGRVVRTLLLRLLNKTSSWWGDEQYLRMRFRLCMQKELNLKNPTTFSEKLQWMKLYDHRPEYTIMADKVRAKEWVAERIGEEYIIPTLGVWDDPEKIDFDALPNQFVLKCNHNSGTGMFICKDKSSVSPEKWKEVKAGLRKGLDEDYFLHGREWCYKNIPRRILAEKYMEDHSQLEGLNDYKFFCFDGKPKFLKVDYNRFVDHHANYYSIDWKLLSFGEEAFPPQPEHSITKPTNLDKMIEIAQRLSMGYPFVRVDLFEINVGVFFGELTFYPISGMGPYSPGFYDEKIGELLRLPDEKLVKRGG